MTKKAQGTKIKDPEKKSPDILKKMKYMIFPKIDTPKIITIPITNIRKNVAGLYILVFTSFTSFAPFTKTSSRNFL